MAVTICFVIPQIILITATVSSEVAATHSTTVSERGSCHCCCSLQSPGDKCCSCCHYKYNCNDYKLIVVGGMGGQYVRGQYCPVIYCHPSLPTVVSL